MGHWSLRHATRHSFIVPEQLIAVGVVAGADIHALILMVGSWGQASLGRSPLLPDHYQSGQK